MRYDADSLLIVVVAYASSVLGDHCVWLRSVQCWGGYLGVCKKTARIYHGVVYSTWEAFLTGIFFSATR